MIGIYFSGTGNTRYALKKFLKFYGEKKAYSIENPKAIEAIKTSKEIVLAYPIYYSNLPKILRDFIDQNQTIFQGKRIFIIATMGLFSGDGAGCGARLLKQHGAEIIGGLHLKMPDAIADEKVLKRPLEKNQELVKKAEEKIKKAVHALKAGNPTQEGLNIFAHFAGLFGQRLWFSGKTKKYSNQLKIDPKLCIGCQSCVQLCPMKNISLSNHKAVSGKCCTMCYRCVSRCPQKAITLLGKKVVEQSYIEKYITR